MPKRFNEPQRSRILAGVSHVDKLLVEVEEILAASSSPAFPKYRSPLTPAQARTICDYIRRLRQQITSVLNDLEIALPEPKFDSTHAIRVTLQFIEIAIEELSPERLTGYGEVPENLVNRLAGGLQEMKGIARQMDSYLIQRPDCDLGARLSRLSDASALPGVVADLVGIIDGHGLVEFRGPLSQIVEKLGTPAYEIAFFGRVSAGKSSLLNCIIGTELLPTGVTPVTAIPTRIRNRPERALLVWTADRGLSRYEIGRLADFVTEARNPGNDKRVVRLIAEVPLPILPEAVVLVDTPGLGSLALGGAAETLAYLPSCDLGVVLVDSSSNLHADDIATLDALRAASIPSMVVLSKADLVAPEDLERLLDYTRVQIAQQLGTRIAVAPLSSRGEFSHFLKNWVDEQIAPRIAEASRLAAESIERKTDALALRVLHALEMTVKTADSSQAPFSNDALHKAELQLREAASLVESTSRDCFRITSHIRNLSTDAISLLAGKLTSIWKTSDRGAHFGGDWLQREINSIAQNEAEGLVGAIQSTARRLSEALDMASLATSAGERSERFSLESLVKELPAPAFSGCAIELRPPRLLAILTGLALGRISSQLSSACGTSLVQFFDSYGRSVELWFRDTLASLETEFNRNAEVYRAQLQRLAALDVQKQPADDSVLEDISLLKRAIAFPKPVDHA